MPDQLVPFQAQITGTVWAQVDNFLGAIDFTTVDVWTPKGLRTIYLLFAMQIATRKVQCLGSTEQPNEAWMLDKATAIFLKHYHDERPHQGLGNERIIKFVHPPPAEGEVVVDKRLGGLLKSYRRAA